jgi:hypothetical protein
MEDGGFQNSVYIRGIKGVCRFMNLKLGVPNYNLMELGNLFLREPPTTK